MNGQYVWEYTKNDTLILHHFGLVVSVPLFRWTGNIVLVQDIPRT